MVRRHQEGAFYQEKVFLHFRTLEICVLSRLTEARVRALLKASDGFAATTAFAFGAVAGYSANSLGSSYLAHTVGGLSSSAECTT